MNLYNITTESFLANSTYSGSKKICIELLVFKIIFVLTQVF